MPWVLLVLAGLLEIVWAAAMPASFVLLALAMRSLPLGTAYMVWTGIGAVGAFLFGVVWLQEAVTPMRLVAAAMIAGGIVLMKLA